MIQGSEVLLLRDWQNCYMLIGTAAATLTGLMFVVTTLVAGIETHASTLNAGTSAFNTPTVVHFGAVLLIAAMLSAPWQAFSSVSPLLGLFGLGMVFYLLIIIRRMWRVTHYQSTREDWLWYMALPLLAHIMLIVSALLLPANPAPALYIVGSAMILLLLVGIRNSWDNVTFLAVRRSQSEDMREEKKRSGSSNQENRKSQ